MIESRGPAEVQQTYWETLKPAGAPHASWGPADLLGAAQTDKQSLSPTGAPQPDWSPADLLGDAKTGWGPADLLGAAQTDKQSLSPADPADLLGASQTTGVLGPLRPRLGPTDVGIGSSR